MQDQIDSFAIENENLKERLRDKDKKMDSLEEKLNDADRRSVDAKYFFNWSITIIPTRK
jgi:predicted RNase H-like nuclease (RuvC/YqgF family)